MEDMEQVSEFLVFRDRESGEHYQLTDEEIATGISMQGDQNLEESAYESMAEDALERMEEQK